MGMNIFIGCILIMVTIIIHTVATRLTIALVKRKKNKPIKHEFEKPFRITILVLILFFASIIETILWAFSYVQLDAISSFEEALYFSIVTFTTLGYGDIVLNQDWRLLSSFEASIGIIIFGWSTALVMLGVQRFFLEEIKN